MNEEEGIEELGEKIESLEANTSSLHWKKHLPIITIIIAVASALASLFSGSYVNESLIEKNNATLFQSKASDQWSYYQAKGVKGTISDDFYKQTHIEGFKLSSDQYASEQISIKKSAEDFEKQVDEANKKSDILLEKHHRVAFAVTFFQIAVALIALASLSKKKIFFVTSLTFSLLGIASFLWGLF